MHQRGPRRADFYSPLYLKRSPTTGPATRSGSILIPVASPMIKDDNRSTNAARWARPGPTSHSRKGSATTSTPHYPHASLAQLPQAQGFQQQREGARNEDVPSFSYQLPAWVGARPPIPIASTPALAAPICAVDAVLDSECLQTFATPW